MRSLPAECARGFGATAAIVMLSLGTLALALTVLSASVEYSDSVDREAFRIQKSLDQRACDDLMALIREKDAFAAPSCLDT